MWLKRQASLTTWGILHSVTMARKLYAKRLITKSKQMDLKAMLSLSELSPG